MAFIQIIDVKTKELDKVQALDREYEAATAGKTTARRSITCRDRNDPDRHLVMVFFDSYESAMENSNLPETQEFAARWAELTLGPPTFVDLDVIDDHEI
jgi:hypothetical protein